MSGVTAEIHKENGFMTSGQINTYYEVHYSLENKHKTPFVLLAGGPGLSFTTLSPLLNVAVDRPIIAYDQIGSGKSSRLNKIQSLDVTHFITQFEDLMSELHIENYHLLGHSWGSILAAQITLNNPNKTKSLILHSGIADFQHCLNEREKASFTTLDDAHYCRVTYPNYLAEAISDKDTRTNELIWNPKLNPEMYRYDVTRELHRIDCPTLIISGKYDGISVGQGDLFLKGIKNSRHIVFQHSAHYAHVEEEEKFIKEVRSHLRAVRD